MRRVLICVWGIALFLVVSTPMRADGFVWHEGSASLPCTTCTYDLAWMYDGIIAFGIRVERGDLCWHGTGGWDAWYMAELAAIPVGAGDGWYIPRYPWGCQTYWGTLRELTITEVSRGLYEVYLRIEPERPLF